MAAPGTLTKPVTAPTKSFNLVFSHFLLTVSEQTATGLAVVGRFSHPTEESVTKAAFEAQAAGYEVAWTEVHKREG